MKLMLLYAILKHTQAYRERGRQTDRQNTQMPIKQWRNLESVEGYSWILGSFLP